MWNVSVLWVFFLSNAPNFIIETEDNSRQRKLYNSSTSKSELLCQYKMISWHYIATKSSIIDQCMPEGIYCIHFHICRSIHPEVFPVYSRTSMWKCDFNFTVITLLRGYSSVNMLHICSWTPFLENASGELLLYIVLNKEVITVDKKAGKNFLKYFNVMITF